ncbi:3-oxoacyl-ACP synthase [Noviherbaspirillum saxi]|uniref:3-oxoacyl-ACP synthase n=2 Tax=Noviherbaspirillum saxi TaxID=2320863 RepID=A0A3A3FPS9_9BURK|nr:3-oxoacyl-ACP synthase [Noviherbaspirillum saxi]
MRSSSVHFSITSDAAWAPGIETREAWLAWAQHGGTTEGSGKPKLQSMAVMQRRRVGMLGKMALEVAYACLGERTGVPTIFCSRHGEVSRSVDLLSDLAAGEPLSPTSFGLSVHNAIGGMFSIVRDDQANHIALSAGQSSVEHAVVEACGLLNDGEKAVLLVVYDCPLPGIYTEFQDVAEQPFAWAWLIEPPLQDVMSLSWSEPASDTIQPSLLTGGLEILRFHLLQSSLLERRSAKQSWRWSRHA